MAKKAKKAKKVKKVEKTPDHTWITDKIDLSAYEIPFWVRHRDGSKSLIVQCKPRKDAPSFPFMSDDRYSFTQGGAFISHSWYHGRDIVGIRSDAVRKPEVASTTCTSTVTEVQSGDTITITPPKVEEKPADNPIDLTLYRLPFDVTLRNGDKVTVIDAEPDGDFSFQVRYGNSAIGSRTRSGHHFGPESPSPLDVVAISPDAVLKTAPETSEPGGRIAQGIDTTKRALLSAILRKQFPDFDCPQINTLHSYLIGDTHVIHLHDITAAARHLGITITLP